MSVDRSLKLLASVVAIWSFTALAATGQLSTTLIVVVYAAYAVHVFRGHLYRRISSSVWTLSNIIVFVLVAIFGYFDFGNALVYGTVYLQIQKLARYERPRDHLWLFLLSFFQVVLSAAISVELSFLVTMVGFLGMATLALALLTLERIRLETQRRAARIRAKGGVGRPLALVGAPEAAWQTRPATGTGNGFLPSQYVFRMVAVAGLVVLVSVFFFVTIPRLAVRKFFMRLRPFESENVTGFSDQVILGQLGDMATNRALVMRVWVNPQNAGGGAMPSVLRMRGVALDSFDGTKWSLSDRVRRDYEPVRNIYSQRSFPVPFAADPSHHMHLRVEQYLTQTKWIFGPPFVSELEFDHPCDLLFYRESHAFQIYQGPPNLIGYRVTAPIEPPAPAIRTRTASAAPVGAGEDGVGEDAPGGSWTLWAEERDLYLQLPRRLPEQNRLRALAREVTQGARTPLERISRLSRFFHEQFRYSLKVEETDQTHHLISFLFDRREGHCETFAAAMAVLCRLVGVPSRVVNGFYTSDFNRFEQFFYIRQSHAHTWVETWLDGFGWLTVDPTPPAALAPESDQFAFLVVLRDYWDSWTVHWRRYVVDYSLTDQWQVFLRARQLLAPLQIEPFPRRHIPFSRALQNWVVRLHQRNQEQGYTLHKFSLAGLVLAWVFYRRQQRRNGHSPAKQARRDLCPVEFYANLLQTLKRHGWRRRSDQTPAEFAQTVGAEAPDLADFSALTEIYYRIRFSGGPLYSDEGVRANAFLSRLGKLR